MNNDHTNDIQFLQPNRCLEGLRTWASGQRRIALDTETTGLDPRAPDFDVRQLCFGAADGTAFVLDGRHKDHCRAAIRAVRDTGRPLWAHNATFDALAIGYGFQFKLKDLRCSLLASRWVWPELRISGYSLKTLRPATATATDRLARRYESAGGSTAGQWLPNAVASLPPNDPALMAYVATDAIETARLVDALADAAPPDALAAILSECRLSDHWRWVTARGFRIDERRLEQELESLAGRRASSERRWGVDLTRNSNATRSWLDDRGVRCLDPEGKSTLSHKHFDSAVVPDGSRADWREFTELRQSARDAGKLEELAGALRHRRVHPTVEVYGASTGRMAIKDPALQNIPSGLRGLFLAEEGAVLLGCDLDRVEPNVAAVLSGDDKLKDAVSQDVYVELAVAVWGEPARLNGARRVQAKTALLAQLYGQGTRSLAHGLGVAETDASDVVARLRASFPDLFQWIERVRHQAREGQPISTLKGRPLPPTREAPYRAVNWTVQGSAADLFKDCTLRAVGTMDAESLWLPIHDELIVQVEDNPEVIASALTQLQMAMTTTLDGVTIGGEAELIGHRWAKTA